VRLFIGRLTQREQVLVVGGGIVAAALLLVLGGVILSRAIDRQQRSVDSKTQQLMEVLALRGDFHRRQEEHAQRLNALSQSHVRLVSLVEESARTAGIEIGQLRPEDSEPGTDGVYESRVDLRASGLSADRLQEFVNLIEAGNGIIIIRHVKLTRPYKKDVAELELSVSAFKMKA
jgi:hypothetical protein